MCESVQQKLDHTKIHVNLMYIVGSDTWSGLKLQSLLSVGDGVFASLPF